MNGILILIVYHIIKHLIKEYYPRRTRFHEKLIKYNVNGRFIGYKTHQRYYWRVLNIPRKILYIDVAIIEEYYQLSMSPDESDDVNISGSIAQKIYPASVEDKIAAKQFIIDRIHYMHSLN